MFDGSAFTDERRRTAALDDIASLSPGSVLSSIKTPGQDFAPMRPFCGELPARSRGGRELVAAAAACRTS
jgi:hypothetical protein